ncbi:ABC transporter ATP-binding protein [Devosia epidermidihirudinis]|uniref:ABC transporter ATP-binding protein n=1 Tax=Devosia epidermidihirudinis TaxID=1293439 RepID=A0A0F5QDJ2_9HYPH|nr:ATP-binding cassette domain-containing protein [Devosia epidermidihirudinis]KKC38069.1 ABC transporter ATP-binding protein [Devosia epidermidihirudinis]
MPRVSFEHITKTYGQVQVLDDLNLAIDDGDFLVLLGPSGCGKTTLLNLLAGLLDVTDGRIMIGDRDVTDVDPKDRGLAMVFQSYALYPTKTVHGNLKFGLAASKLPREEIEKRIAWAAKLLQIEPLLNRKPANLSGGQRQRVAIGRALVKNVGVFLFDEPLSNLDAKLRTEMRLEIKKLHDTLKHTIVYVTHDQIEAMTMATKIAVMNGGVIQQFGTPDDIYERPANLFVASFIGSPGMNLRPAKLAVGGGKVEAVFPSGVRFDVSDYNFVAPPKDGEDVIAGLRPEHFLVGAGDGAATFDIPVQYAERTGPDASAYFNFENELLALRVDPDIAARLKPGEHATVRYLRGKANLFDARSGQRM